ncbi:type I restriction endonuclease subunit M [Pseudomonas sp. WN033]|nr:type I restriction endonuclease subunit M [Pseudomonas sp. WN033]
MGSDFFETTIGHQVTLQRGYDITKKDQKHGDFPVVSSGGISSFHNEAKVSAPGVVLGRKGSLGTVFYIDSDFWPHDTTLWVKDFKKNYPRFVYYFFRNMAPELKKMDVGAANPALNRNHVHPLPVIWPSAGSQRKIADFLGTLDDKIELNRQMNTTLEAMAQALFKSWFVDFDPVIDNALAAGNEIPEELVARAERRAKAAQQPSPEHPHTLPAAIRQQFPDRFVFTEAMGWVPEGWEAVSLENIVELIGGGTPKTSIEEYWGGDIPWFSVVDAPAKSDVFVLRTEKNITKLGLENSSTKLLPEGTTIISARGTVGKCALVGQAMAMNQSCYGVRGKSGIADYFVYYTILLRVSDLQQRGHGSVFNTITRDTFKSIPTPRCPVSLTIAFHNQVVESFSRIRANNQQIDCLAQLRDTLLPKLLSGQLRIPEAEKMLAEAL